jgi:hypothetical protein
MRKKVISLPIFVLFAGSLIFGQDSANFFNRGAYYKAMELDKMDLVDQQLNILKSISFPGRDRDAFVGAMIMKKAGLSSNAEKRLNLFKSGHRKLEAAIRRDSANAEFRFLRLMIQEHAPRVLGYKGSLKSDSEYIRNSYKHLPREVQQAVYNYSKKSKFLVLGTT